jgi:hypothetical protein
MSAGAVRLAEAGVGAGATGWLGRPGSDTQSGHMELRWTAHPARRRPRDMALVVAVVFMTAGAVLASFESVFFTLLAVAIVLVSVGQFLFPTRYRLDDRGIEERRFGLARRRSWRDLRRLQVGRDAVLVSPFARPSWLDRYRGFFLQLDGADRDAVVGELKWRIERRAGNGEGRGAGEAGGTSETGGTGEE